MSKQETRALELFESDLNKGSFLAQIAHEKQIIQAFEVFRAARIEPILIKGFSLARFYPAEKRRMIGDIDLSVDPSEFARAAQVLKRSSLPINQIDLHRGLRHLDKLPYRELFAGSQLINLMNVNIRVLRSEDSFRVACVHWLTDGGANREKLWDIYYLIANRPPDFDWQRCLNAAGERRRQWFISMIALAHRYLNLNVDDLPVAAKVKDANAIPRWLTKALEKEWNDPVALHRMDKLLHSWQGLKQQLRKRFPPNPIIASIDLEAPFDDSSRLPYQIADIGLRFARGFTRLMPAVYRRLLTNRRA